MTQLPLNHAALQAAAAAEPQVILVARCPQEAFEQRVYIGPHLLVADELPAAGGDDRGPDPFQLLQAALGACTSMTLGVYARRKGWPLGEVTVRVARRREAAAGGVREVFTRQIEVGGPLDAEQRTRLLEIANKCPVHKALTGDIQIETTLEAVG